MTWPAALPGAALRVVRTAAGRRAVQAVLLVGGLFALGFLCGERAYAADGVPVGTVSAASVSSVSTSQPPPSPSSSSSSLAPLSAAEPGVRDEPTVSAKSATPRGGLAPRDMAPRHPAPEAPAPQDHAPEAGAPHPNDGQILSPVTPHLTQAVGTHVVQPVGELVRTVTEGLADVQAKVPPLASLPTLPSLPLLPTAPEAPAWPSPPGLEFPGLPELPGTELPGNELPGLPAVPGQTLPAPVTGAPQPGSAAPASGAGRDDEGRTGEGRTGEEAATVVSGLRFVADVTVSHAPVVGGVHRSGTFGHAPVHQAPVDQPGGVLANRSAGDSGASRHGDAHAVSLNQRAPLRLVPGAAARVDADEIQDRHRDIPVSPA